MSAQELLPCPFCGVSDHLSAIKTGSAAGHYYPYAVVCRHLDCDDVRGPTGNGKHEAIAAWNLRTPPAMSADHSPDAGNMVAPVEAVAWRWKLDGKWFYAASRPANVYQRLPGISDVQPLYTHPPQPDALPGDLRERVAGLINDWPFHTKGVRANELTDAILALIQSERAG